MKSIYELQQIANRLRAVAEVDSISPEDTFGLQSDVLAYIADMEQSADGLGIRKVYKTKAAMAADTDPVGTNGKALRYGQLVSVYDTDNATSPENSNIYAWQKPGWHLIGNMGSIYELKQRIDEETEAREAGDGALSVRLKELSDWMGRLLDTMQSRIDLEYAARTDADNALDDKLEAEIKNRNAGEEELASALEEEAKKRESADTALGKRIDNENADREMMYGVVDTKCDLALSGATARFDGIVDGVSVEPQSTIAEGVVVYDRTTRAFLLKVVTSGVAKYYGNWVGADMYMAGDRTAPRKDKIYLLGSSCYVWSDEEGTLVESGGGSGSGFFNVTAEIPLPEGYYDKETAIAALADADIKDERKAGMILTFEKSAGVWSDYRFVGSDIGTFLSPAGWEEYGGGKIKSVTLNGSVVSPDVNGNVALVIDQITVDESLDAESTNPVQNAAVAARMGEIGDAAVGGVEVIEGEDKNTLNILNKRGGVIASTEFTGGGGGGSSTASRIVLTAALDKAQVKEGGTAALTYSYNHVNADGESDGVKADITITISRGTTQTYQATKKNVGAGTYTLDISDYLLVGTTDVYVRAEAITEDGTRQTKQSYASINVITLTLTSSYNLGTTIAGGGYKNGDTIEIPFTITGSGTKDVSMYLDGSETPTVQTINKSGTVNGSFAIQGSTLTAGRHTVQLVAERSGLKSDSIFIDLLKSGSGGAFVGVKYTDRNGGIRTGDGITPHIKAGQYEQLSFQYVAYDPSTTPATVEVWADGALSQSLSVPRSMQTYTNRPTVMGTQELELRVGTHAREVTVEVVASSVSLSEATYGLVAKLDATGRSNGESAPAVWESGDVKTAFDGFDWSSNGWTGDSLRLTNGAKATIGFQPFKTDVKATGLTIEITMRVSNVMTRGASVVSCIDGGKGLLLTTDEASFKTGQSVTYTNENDEQVTREIRLGTNYVADSWIKAALVISTKDNNRLMELYVNGNRTGADIYDTNFNFQQDNPQDIVIDSAGADVEIRSIRIYNRAVSDDEELENRIVDAETSDRMLSLYDENNILGDTGKVDIDKIRAKGKGVLRIVRPNKLDDVYAENNKKTDFKSDIYFYSPYGKEYDFVLKDCNIRIQGTSSTKYPSKNIRIYLSKGGEGLSLTVGGVPDPNGQNRYAMRPGAIPMNLICCKSDYSDSSMSLNTGGAKLFNDVFKELGLLTPPQRYQYEHGGSQTSAINVRTAIDGIPIDIFCAETEDGESEYYGQYNLNNEKSKSQALFGQEGLDGYTPECPLTLETLNNGEKACLFQSSSDEDLAQIFDAGLETNYPDDVKWAGLNETQKAALTRLFGWIRACVPAGAESSDLTTFKSTKFVNEIDQYFDKDFLLTYYLWTDYFLSVDQRAKNMLLRTWDGLKWYITYYDGDTQLGKRNDCFLVYGYTTDRDTYDAEASKYAFEGRDSWLWNLVLANLQDDLRTCAARLRQVMTNERVLDMFNTEQSGHWGDRAFNKSGELKYIKPAVQAMYGKVWPYIYALQGSNTPHREFFIKNRFALLDAKYGTANFTSDNIDLYVSRSGGEAADMVRVTANEPYAFGYGTNNSPNIANTGIIGEGETAELEITGAYTVNDPLRLYGASRMRVLDMTGAADHLKNALDLGKCGVLQEINLQSAGSGSTGWWLVLSACRSLRRLNVRNQAQAKTGGSTSRELDLTANTKLEYLDARGTQVEGVSFAQGSPVRTALLPATLRTLRLEYLRKLATDGLTLESWAGVETVVFAGCPNLDWQSILSKCTGIRRVRVEGVDMEDDGTLLRRYMDLGGIDAGGNAVDYCALVGTVRLTRYMEDHAAMCERYPELNIIQTDCTVLAADDVADPENYTNLDNKTGYAYGNTYMPSGHVAEILSRRHCCLVKRTGDGEVTVFPLHDSNRNFLADAESIVNATPSVLTGEQGQVMIYEPHYWYKGVNDFLGRKNYSVYSSNETCPAQAEGVRLGLGDVKVMEGQAVRMDESITTFRAALVTASGMSCCQVAVSGYRMVRWPSLKSIEYGAVFCDAEGNIVKRSKANTGSGIADGMYCFTDVPAGAVSLMFTIAAAAPFDYVLLSKSDKVEDMEPDWVEHPACLTGVYRGRIENELLMSVSGVVPNYGFTLSEARTCAKNRGRGFQLADYEMHKDVCNLFYAKYGNRNSQVVTGTGWSNVANLKVGVSDATGMQDTKATASDSDNPPSIESNGYYEQSGYIQKSPDDETRTKILLTVLLGYEEWVAGRRDERIDCDLKGFVLKSTMPDGTARQVRLVDTWASGWPRHLAHGRYMDVTIYETTFDGSATTYFCDQQRFSGTTAGGDLQRWGGQNSECGISVLKEYGLINTLNNRLAFRGTIKFAESASAFLAIEEVG